MKNFLNFIEEDIQTKKTLFSSMPTKTKSNIKKFNERVEEEEKKYKEYKNLVYKYITAKSETYNIVKDNSAEIDKISTKLKELEHVKFILNPTNTYFEKIGFDTLFYQIRNYHDLKFNCLNDIINEFLNKFEAASVMLLEKDFNYTFYVNEFMSSFLEIRRSKNQNFEKMTEIFEKIYWVNPEIVQHIELNFRKLIKKNEKKFKDFINKKQAKVLAESKLSYVECLDKLKDVYKELAIVERENISDIIEIAKKGDIDINNYFEDSKVRITTYNDFMIDAIDFSDEEKMSKFYENLEKLKQNLREYEMYVRFKPLIEDFKKEYFSNVSTENSNDSKLLKDLETKINNNEKKLDKINKKILGTNRFFAKKELTIKELKFESFKVANELCENYKELEKESFKAKVRTTISSNFTVPDLLHLYYSFDYFKKMAIKRIFTVTNYDEIMRYSESFDLFAMNPNNLIIRGITVNDDNNIARTIVNKYRLVNIAITEEDLATDDLSLLIERINMLLRIKEIEESKISIEKIWFMCQVAKYSEKVD